MICEGCLPYLKKWAKLQVQTRAEVRADPDNNKIHSDLQHLAPGGPSKFGDLQELTKSDDTTRPFAEKISDSPDYSQICAKDKVP